MVRKAITYALSGFGSAMVLQQGTQDIIHNGQIPVSEFSIKASNVSFGVGKFREPRGQSGILIRTQEPLILP